MCGDDLSPADGFALRCPAGHSHDSNRRGWLTALDGSRGVTGDPRQLLEARSRFLEGGHYLPIAEAAGELVARAAPAPADRPRAVLEAGTGTGWYLAQLRDAGLADDPLALDASSAAVAMSVAATGAVGLVADTWRPLPVRSGRADVILCVFAPRNADEFARMLRPGGVLVVVTPGPGHLAELRDAGLVMGMQADKEERLAQTLGSLFTPAESRAVRYCLELDAPTARLVADMGPSGHHEARGSWNGGTVTVDMRVSSWVA